MLRDPADPLPDRSKWRTLPNYVEAATAPDCGSPWPAHCALLTAPAGDVVCAGHAVGAADPRWQYDPAGHSAGADARSGQKLPAGQRTDLSATGQ